MKKSHNWYVITGGPNSGKTTTVDYLKKLGYKTVPEYARRIIKRDLANGKKLEEIRKDEVKFQDRITKGILKLEEKVPKNQIVFFDRSIVDNIAYYYFLKADPLPELIKHAKNRYNKKVFLLDMFPYHKDYARKENRKAAQTIHKTLRRVYKNLGYKIIRVPVMSIEDRAKFILKHVSSS